MWTTTDLLADVRRLAMLPSTATLGTTNSDLLAYADQEMASRLVPMILSVNEEFYVQTVDIPLVAGQSAYRMPNRNAGARLREVQYAQGAVLTNLTRLEPEMLDRFTTTPVGTPMGFYMDAGALNVVPTPSTGGFLRMRYYVRPGRLTATATDYATIATITSYTVSSSGGAQLAGTFSGSLTTAATLDVIAFRPPFEYLAVDAAQFTFAAPNFTILGNGQTATVLPNIAVGDYLCHSDLSPVIQLPVELQPLLTQRVVCSVFEALNYTDRLKAAEDRYARMEEMALKLITPRIDGASKKMRGVLSTLPNFMVYR